MQITPPARLFQLALLAAVCLSIHPLRAQDPNQQSQQPEPTYTTTHLDAVVVSSLDGKPVPRVLVTSPDRRMAAITDSEGRFSFDLRRVASQSSRQVFSSFPYSPAGIAATIPIQFNVRKPGYISNTVTLNVAATPPDTPEPALQLKIVPAAVLTGHLSPDSGDLPAFINVELYSRQIYQGSTTWNPNRGTRVDSHGQFRFADLPPGDYKLVAPASVPNDAKDTVPGSAPGFRATFYPNADSLDSATVLHLGPGESTSANLTYRSATFYLVTVPVTGLTAPHGFYVNLLSAAPGLQMNNDVDFARGYLPTGSYDLILAAAPNPVPANTVPTQSIASVHIQVDGKPVNMLPVALHPALELPVIMHLEFTNTTLPTPDPQRPQPYAWVNLQPVGNVGLQPSPQNVDGSMVIRNLSPGLFHVMVSPSFGGYVASVTSGTTDLLREPLRIVAGSDPRPIEVTLRDDFASLTGHIATDPTQPATSQPTFVLCVPLDRPDTQPFNFFAQQNQLATQNLPPGRYLILASHNLQLFYNNLEYANQDVLRDLTSKGTTVTLSSGQKADTEIPLMPDEEAK